MRFLTLLSAAGHFTATSAFYPYQRTGADAVSPARRNAHLLSRQPPSIRIPLRKVKRSSVFKITHSDNPSTPNSAPVDQDGADYSYMSELQFGANKKSMFLLLDTAAVNTWVMSSNCTTTSCTSHNTYGNSDSSSLQISQNPFSISYGTGSVSGTVGTDNVNFIGKSFALTFGLASTVSDEFQSYPMDGILGVGRLDNVASNPNGVKAPTLVDVLVSEKVISSKVFGLRLSRTADGHNNGEINFGAPDTSAFTGQLHYVPALKNDRGFWEIAIDSIKFNEKTAAIQQGATALLDSGTSFLLLPPADAQAIHSQIPNSAQNGESFTVPCDTNTPLIITFGGMAINISPKDYIGAPSGGKCLSNIIARQTFNSNQWLMGDVLLKNIYTLFDSDGDRVGFGTLTGGSTVSSSTPPLSQQQTGSTAPAGTHSPQIPPSPSTIQVQGTPAQSLASSSKASLLTQVQTPASTTASGSVPSASGSRAPIVSASHSTSGASTTSGSSVAMSLSRSSWAVVILSVIVSNLVSFL